MFRNTLLSTAILLIELKPIIHTILRTYALPWNGVHGVAHWARVLENGVRLATDTGAVLEVVRLFAVFHDSRRVNDHGDYGHGRRGAELATELRGTLFDTHERRSPGHL